MEKPTKYYTDLILEILRDEYDEEENQEFMIDIVSGDPWYGECLKEQIETAENDAWLRHHIVDEYEYTRSFIENDLASLLDIKLWEM